MNNVGEYIKMLRIEKGMTQEELGELVGVKKAAVQKWESGLVRNLKRNTIKQLSVIFGVSPVSFVTESDEQSNIQSADELPNNKIFMIPVFDSVSAGFGAYANELVVDYVPTYIGNACDASNYIRINVKGDSMSPLIDDGSQIIVRKQTSADNGAIAVVLIDDDSAVVKKIKYGKGYFELISINPYYPPRRFEDEDIERIKILGVVKEVRKLL